MDITVLPRTTAHTLHPTHRVRHPPSHANASLSKGVLAGERIVCPWHAACYNVTTGDIEDGPGLDALPTFPVTIERGQVCVDVPAEGIPKRVVPNMCPVGAKDSRHFVVIGAGPAGATAAETLRAEGFTGMISMIAMEAELPYDRTKLSKNFRSAMESVPALRPREFYVKAGIALRLGQQVTSIDATERCLTIQPVDRPDAPSTTLHYDKLLVATGGAARTFKPHEGFTIAGADLRNIYPLRTAEDARGVVDVLKTLGGNARVVVMGSSFIGMEAAAYLTQSHTRENRATGKPDVASITVVGMEEEPFERVLGSEVGASMRALAAAKNVQFRMKALVSEFTESADRDGAVGSVLLKSGEVLPADLVIIGAGIIPATQLLEAVEGVKVERGGVEVDEYMCATRDVYVAGDIAKFPFKLAVHASSASIRVEHWNVAMDQGRIAARNMLGKLEPYCCVPFFWTSQFGANVRYAGNAMQWKTQIIQGKMEGDRPAYVVYFVTDEDRINAVMTVNKDPQGVAAYELLRMEKMPSPMEVRAAADVFDLVAHLNAV